MTRLLEKLLAHPMSGVMFFATILLLGLISLLKLPQEYLPNISLKKLTIITVYPNAAPHQVEEIVTRPITDSVGTISGVEEVESFSHRGVSAVTLKLNWNADLNSVSLDIREKLDLLLPSLPYGVQRPIVAAFDPSQEPIYRIAVLPKGKITAKELKSFIKDQISDRISRIDGIAAVRLNGGFDPEIRVDVDQESMLSHGVRLSQIVNSLRRTNVDLPAGSITEGNREILVRTSASFNGIEDIGGTIIDNGNLHDEVKLSKIARIYSAFKERKSAARFNGQECVLISIYKQSARNTVELSGLIREKLSEIESDYSEAIQIQTIFDAAIPISSSIESLESALFLGTIITVAFLYWLTRGFLIPTIIVVCIPPVLAFTFLMLYIMDISINMMSLGGIAVALGMLYDSNTVVISSINYHYQRLRNKREAIILGVRQVTGSVITATATTVLVFFPIVFLDNIMGALFKDLALSLSLSLVASAMAALFLVPIAVLYFPVEKLNSNDVDVRMERLYNLHWKVLSYFRERIDRIVIIGTILAILCLLTSWWFIDKTLFPKIESNQINLTVSLPTGSKLEQTEEVAEFLEEKILENQEVISIQTEIGSQSDSYGTSSSEISGPSKAKLILYLDTSTSDLIDKLRDKIKLPEQIHTAIYAADSVISEYFSAENRDIRIRILGSDLESIKSASNALYSKLLSLPDVVDLDSDLSRLRSEIQIRPIAERTGTLGIDNQLLAETLSTALSGSVASELTVNEDDISIVVEYAEKNRSNLSSLEKVAFQASKNGFVSLSHLVHVDKQEDLPVIKRLNNSLYSEITGNILNDRMNTMEEVKRLLHQQADTGGIRAELIDSSTALYENIPMLAFTLLLSMALIFMLLVAKLESMKLATYMMLLLPSILMLLLPILTISGAGLNVSSFIGFVLLVGVSVDSSILFFEYFSDYRFQEGRSKVESLREASKRTLQPLILNTGTTILSLLPILFQSGEANYFQIPLAMTVIIGLILSFSVSLLAFPALLERHT